MTEGGFNSTKGVLWPLVRALMRVSCLAELSGRNLVARIISDELGHPLSVDEYPQSAAHLFSLVEACRRRPDGLSTMLYVLDRLEQGATAMIEVRRVIADMITYDTIAPEDRRQLFTLLSGVVVSDISGIYRFVAGQSALELPEQTTYQEMFLALETLNANVGGIPKPLVFVEHLAARVRLDLAVELRRWVDGQAEKMGLLGELNILRGQLATRAVPAPPRRSDAYVVVQIQRIGPTGDRYRLSNWKQLDSSGGWCPDRGHDVTAASLPEMKYRIADLIESVEAEWAQFEPNIRLEFLLSMELLNLDVDQWQWETESRFPEPMGCRFPVSVRSLERMKARKWHRSWFIRWKELKDQVNGKGTFAVDSGFRNRANSIQGLRELIATFERSPGIVSLVLSSPPVAGVPHADEVAVGLRAGIPVILWHRENCDSEEFAATIEDVLYQAGSRHLLDRVRLVRANAFADGSGRQHVGSQLTVLWDDPERMVIPAEGVPA